MHSDVEKIKPGDRRDLRVAVVVGQFNSGITQGLLDGAKRALNDAGVVDDRITVYSVAGSFEVVELVSVLAKRRVHHVIVALGAIVRGETTHDQHLADAVTNGILRAAQETGVPIGLGIVTVLNVDQGMARAAADDKNRGYHAAKAALELFDTMGTP